MKTLRDAAGAKVALVEDGKPLAALADPVLSGDGARLTFCVVFDGKRHWLRADLRDAKGRLLTVGNPVYVNF